MTDQNTETQKGFIRKPYVNKNTDTEALEQEVQAMEQARSTPVQVEDTENIEPISSEDATFKKRYGDLRRHSQKVEKELKDEVNTLKNSIEELKKELQNAAKGVGVPSDPDEVEEWVKENPSIASILERIASKKAEESQKDLREKVLLFEKDKAETEYEKTLNKIRRKHPFFDDLQDEDDFHLWLAEKPKRWQDAIYDDLDADSAIEIIRVFVEDTGYGKQKTKPKKALDDAARDSKVKSKFSEPKDSEYMFSESQIRNMSTSEFEKNEEKITLAQHTGKILYDISGGARL